MKNSALKADIKIADQILATNTDRNINVANTQTFDASVQEDVVKWYRRVASLMLKNQKTIEQNLKKIDSLVT